MKLSKGTIRPGTVLEVFDNGEIKAAVPGLFTFVEDTSKLPPIMAWQIGGNCNSYSKPLVGEDVWVMNYADNPRQLYWFRKDHATDCDNIDFSEKNVEVLCNRDVKGRWGTIYLSDGSGWVIANGNSVMQIKPDGSIQLNTGLKHRMIDVNTQGISLGSEGKSAHPAAYGDVVVDALNAICTLFAQIQIAATPNPYTAAIGAVIGSSLTMVNDKIDKIVSPHVTLD